MAYIDQFFDVLVQSKGLRFAHRRGRAAEDPDARRDRADPRGADHQRGGRLHDERDLRAEGLGDLRGTRRLRLRLRDERGVALPLQLPQADQRLRLRVPVDPDEDRHARTTQGAAGHQGIRPLAQRLGAGHGADRLGQEHDAGGVDRLHQHQFRPAHRHGGGTHRVRAHQQEKHHHPARGARAHAELPGRV